MHNELSAAIRAVLLAGAEILDVYQREIQVTNKADLSPLTEADTRGHDAIMRELTVATPDIPVLSEEGATIPYTTRKLWTRYWLVDPLDGTKEFIKRNEEFTVNIALMDSAPGAAATPTAGVVYVPATQTLYVGHREVGAWRLQGQTAATATSFQEVMAQGDTLPTTQDRNHRPYTIVASRSHMSSATEQFVQTRRDTHPDLNLVTAGSSIKICRVAEGSADEYPRFAPTMEWDTAAGDAVARATGCRVFQWDKDNNTPTGVLRYNKADLHNPWFLVQRTAETNKGT